MPPTAPFQIVRPSAEITVHPTIASALAAMHDWMAYHPDAALWIADLPIDRQLHLTDMAIRCYLAGRIAQEKPPCESSGTPCSVSSFTGDGLES